MTIVVGIEVLEEVASLLRELFLEVCEVHELRGPIRAKFCEDFLDRLAIVLVLGLVEIFQIAYLDVVHLLLLLLRESDMAESLQGGVVCLELLSKAMPNSDVPRMSISTRIQVRGNALVF